MTPQELEDLHAKAFTPERGWSATEFSALCASSHVRVFSADHGFALIRTVADETELLTLAVDPRHRRQGIAHDLMQNWMSSCPAQTAFLEVAADNQSAISLYTKFGFEITGRRKAYYARQAGVRVDALLMQTALTQRPGG